MVNVDAVGQRPDYEPQRFESASSADTPELVYPGYDMHLPGTVRDNTDDPLPFTGL